MFLAGYSHPSDGWLNEGRLMHCCISLIYWFYRRFSSLTRSTVRVEISKVSPMCLCGYLFNVCLFVL